MRWFKKRKTFSTNLTDTAAHKVVRLVERMQNCFATMMEKAVGKMEAKKLKRILLVFCIVWGGLSCYFITQALIKPPYTQVLRIDHVNMPTHFDKTGDDTEANELVDEATHEKITAFETYMDSLKIHSRLQYDSIVSVRPQLMDSIAWLKDIYSSQQNK